MVLRPRLSRLSSLQIGFTLTFGALAGISTLYLSPTSFPPLFRTLAVAEASLLAIIVSVGLLSIQIAATQFTPLIGRRFKHHPFLTGTIYTFGISIALALLASILIPSLGTETYLSTGLVMLVAFLGVASATASFFGVLTTKDEALEYLDPRLVLDDLLDDVSFDAYQQFSEQLMGEDSSPPRSPVLEIFQIGRGAFEDNDGDTAIYAIYTLNNATQEILKGFGTLPDKERENVQFQQQDLFGHWKRLVDAAMKHGTDSPLYRLSDSQKEIAESAAEYGLASIGGEAAKTLKYLCEKAFEYDRLEKPYYARFKPILEAGIEHDTPQITRLTVTYVIHLSFTLTKDLSLEEDERWITEQRDVQTLFTYLSDSWSMLFESGQPREEKYQELHDTFENEFAHYIRTCWTGRRPFPDDLESHLTTVAKSAAKNDEQWAVKRLTRMLVELWVVADRQNRRTITGLAEIVDSGGQEGVSDAFNEILEYDYIEDGQLEPVIIGEKDWEQKMEHREELAYDNIISQIPRLNSQEGFKDVVGKLRDAVIEKSETNLSE